MQPLNNHKSKLEKLEQKLYSVDGIVSKERPRLHDKTTTLDQEWPSESGSAIEFPKKHIGFFSVVLILAGLFFIGSLSYAGYVFLGSNKGVSASEVDVTVAGPVSIAGGEELTLDVVVSNNNSVPLELVDLFIEYPEGSKDPRDLTKDQRRQNVDLGSISPGSISRETIKVALFGEEASTKRIDFILQYRIPGSNAIFEKKKEFDIVLSATPLKLSVTGLHEMSSGQIVELAVSLNSNSPQVLSDVAIVAEYPFGFKFDKADISPSVDDNIWIFDQLRPGEKFDFKIRGILEGQNEEDRIFRFNTGLLKDGSREEIGVLFGTDIHDIKISRSFVQLQIDINNNPASGVAVESGRFNDGEIIITNNTNDAIKNLVLELVFTGSVLDETSVSANSGFYRSVDNTLIWNKETDEIFANIPPRTSEKLSFRFRTFDLEKGKTTINNPQIDISARINGTRISSDNVEESISSDAFRNIKVISETPLIANTYYDIGALTGTGPIPPRVDTPTVYAIELNLSNSSNELENARVTATLPGYVTWKGSVTPSNESVSYDAGSRVVTWNIGKVEAGAGYTKVARNVFFQVELLPSISQLGDQLDLLNNVNLSARDTFTRTEINRQAINPTTSIKGYPVADEHENVVE